MSAKTSTIILFNPMPVKHPVAILNKKTVSLQVPLVNVPLSLLALARMVRNDFDVKIINAVVDSDYKNRILDSCESALCLAVKSYTHETFAGTSPINYPFQDNSNVEFEKYIE